MSKEDCVLSLILTFLLISPNVVFKKGISKSVKTDLILKVLSLV